MSSSADVTQRTFGGFVALFDFTRKVTLMFGFTAYVERTAASEMQTWLQDATAAPASAFKARGTPEVLRVIEILSIEQGRKWGVCTASLFYVVHL